MTCRQCSHEISRTADYFVIDDGAHNGHNYCSRACVAAELINKVTP